tara:strand:- start:210 stop:881 length:672 start_codon:yes stop_codon:yes gene_type:complete
MEEEEEGSLSSAAIARNRQQHGTAPGSSRGSRKKTASRLMEKTRTYYGCGLNSNTGNVLGIARRERELEEEQVVILTLISVILVKERKQQMLVRGPVKDSPSAQNTPGEARSGNSHSSASHGGSSITPGSLTSLVSGKGDFLNAESGGEKGESVGGHKDSLSADSAILATSNSPYHTVSSYVMLGEAEGGGVGTGQLEYHNPFDASTERGMMDTFAGKFLQKV